MKATLEISALADAARHVLRAADPHQPTVTFDASDGAVVLTAYDGIAHSTARVDARVDEPASFALNGAWLAALAEATRPGEAEVTERDGSLGVRGGDGRLVMRVSPEGSRPPTPAMPDAWTDVDADAFAALVKSVAPMATVRGKLPILDMVRLTCADGMLSAQATDRYKMSARRMEASGMPEGEWLVGGAWLSGVKRADRIGVTPSMFYVAQGPYTDGTALYDGRYPDTGRLWWDARRMPDASVELDRAELEDAVKALSRLAFDAKPDSTIALRLTGASGDLLRVAFDRRGMDGSDGTGGYRVVAADVRGDVDVRADARLLSALLKAWDCERIRLLFHRRDRPVLVRREDEPYAGLLFVPLSSQAA